MKSPFAILLAIVVLIGIAIGVVAIIFVDPTNQDDEETIPIASESELPTPSTRNAPARPQSDADATRSEVVIASTSVTTEENSTDELSPEPPRTHRRRRRGIRNHPPRPAAEDSEVALAVPISKPYKKLWKTIPRFKS